MRILNRWAVADICPTLWPCTGAESEDLHMAMLTAVCILRGLCTTFVISSLAAASSLVPQQGTRKGSMWESRPRTRVSWRNTYVPHFLPGACFVNISLQVVCQSAQGQEEDGPIQRCGTPWSSEPLFHTTMTPRHLKGSWMITLRKFSCSTCAPIVQRLVTTRCLHMPLGFWRECTIWSRY